MIGRILLVAGVALTAGQAVAAQSAQLATTQETAQARVVHLRGLDSLAGEAVDIDVPVGETVRFGRLEILAEACRVPRDDPTADAYAFLKIRDVRERRRVSPGGCSPRRRRSRRSTTRDTTSGW